VRELRARQVLPGNAVLRYRSDIMSVFGFVIIIIVISAIIAPLAKGYGERLSKGGPDPADLARLRAEMEAADQRLGDTERRLQQAEERLDFQEKLLSSRSSIRRDPLDQG
jgi:hypothetical protein